MIQTLYTISKFILTHALYSPQQSLKKLNHPNIVKLKEVCNIFIALLAAGVVFLTYNCITTLLGYSWERRTLLCVRIHGGKSIRTNETAGPTLSRGTHSKHHVPNISRSGVHAQAWLLSQRSEAWEHVGERRYCESGGLWFGTRDSVTATVHWLCFNSMVRTFLLSIVLLLAAKAWRLSKQTQNLTSFLAYFMCFFLSSLTHVSQSYYHQVPCPRGASAFSHLQLSHWPMGLWCDPRRAVHPAAFVSRKQRGRWDLQNMQCDGLPHDAHLARGHQVSVCILNVNCICVKHCVGRCCALLCDRFLS